MNTQRFSLMLVVVAVCVVLSGCAAGWASGDPEPSPTPTRTPEPTQPVSEAPEAVVEAFYDWYLDYIGGPAPDERRNPLVDGAYRSSEYLTEAWIEEVDDLVASRCGYDPFLCAQDVPDTFEVGDVQATGDEASVVLHQIWNADTEYASTRDLTIELRQVDGEWKIDDVICPDPESAGAAPANPALTVQAFYTWYLDYSETGNPMADEAYRSSEYLTEAFVQKVDEILASFEGGGYDPFLCAQDVPQDISVAEMNVSGDEAQVKVQTSFEGHSFDVVLQREGEQWKIADVICAFANEG